MKCGQAEQYLISFKKNKGVDNIDFGDDNSTSPPKFA